MSEHDAGEHERTGRPFLQRVVLRNYRSIAACDIRLQPLTFLVGPNGSGKSNVLDALRFVADALRMSLEYAVRERGGVDEVLRRSTQGEDRFGVRLDFDLPKIGRGHYAFSISVRSLGGYEVAQEECIVDAAEGSGTPRAFFHVKAARPVTSATIAPPASSDRLYLVNAAGLPEFRPVYDALTRMGFYNINPDQLRDMQPPTASTLLTRDGSNIADVLGRIWEQYPTARLRVEQYLAAIVPGVRRVNVRTVGPRRTLEFEQQASESFGERHRFPAMSMSDGTLRALGILVALFQGGMDGNSDVSLVGIEEPESALHPAAAGILLDSLREASTHTQVIITSHSADLLDNDEIPTDAILAVALDNGGTTIGPLDDVGRSVLRDHLFTAGELLRQDQLRPSEASVAGGDRVQIFDEDSNAW
jgi:predicted ATPase